MELIVKQENEVTYLILNRPEKRNALNKALVKSLIEALGKVKTHIVVLQGAGEVFCAGMDLKEEIEEMGALLYALFKCLREANFLTIALAHGAVVAGGIALIACCDLVVADENTQFFLPEVHRGLVPALVMGLLYDKISPRLLADWMLTARKFDVKEALSVHLIHRIGREESLKNVIGELLKGALNAQLSAKKLLRQLGDEGMDMALKWYQGKEAKERFAQFKPKQ